MGEGTDTRAWCIGGVNHFEHLEDGRLLGLCGYKETTVAVEGHDGRKYRVWIEATRYGLLKKLDSLAGESSGWFVEDIFGGKNEH